MRFECKVRVLNRVPGAKRSAQYLKSTIAVGKETHTANDYFLLHFSNTSRGSLKGSRYTKYRLKSNPTQVFTRCILEGKITVSFEDPPHDLFIQGDSENLSKFVDLLNTCLAGEEGALQPSTEAANERYNKYLLDELEKHVLLHQLEVMPEKIVMLEEAESEGNPEISPTAT